jgi:2-keto-3-deoxy-L-rhamnonate aldolase RhmA
VLQACRNTGTAPGIACGSPEDAVRRAQQGFRYLTAGGDAGMIINGAAAGLKTLHAFGG